MPTNQGEARRASGNVPNAATVKLLFKFLSFPLCATAGRCTERETLCATIPLSAELKVGWLILESD